MAIFQESMSKYPSLPNSELLPSKMAKLHFLGKYLLWHHNDVIEALNLELDSFLRNLYRNTPAYQIFTFCLENTKVTRPSMFPSMTSL